MKIARIASVLLNWALFEVSRKVAWQRLRAHRHIAASPLLNINILVIVVSRRLGHAQPCIRLDVSGHLIPPKLQEVASLIDKLLTLK